MGLVTIWMPSRSLMMLCLFLHRASIGINSGITHGVASLYLVEVAPTRIRGLIGTLHQLAITFGILVSQVVGTQLVFGSFGSFEQAKQDISVIRGEHNYRWHWVLGINAIPAIVTFPMLFCSVESPRHLWLTAKKEESAEKGAKFWCFVTS